MYTRSNLLEVYTTEVNKNKAKDYIISKNPPDCPKPNPNCLELATPPVTLSPTRPNPLVFQEIRKSAQHQRQPNGELTKDKKAGSGTHICVSKTWCETNQILPMSKSGPSTEAQQRCHCRLD